MSNENLFETLPESIQEKLKELKIEKPTKVQEKVIPLLLENKNLIFQSETGTGKTFAFLIPTVLKILKIHETENPNERKVRAIICAPTFELASQINQAVKNISDIKSALFIGGSPIKRQTEALKEKPEIVTGTPARLTELIQLKKLKVTDVVSIIFDEADRLVKKELYDETKALLESVEKNVQQIVCTATVDKNTKNFFYACQTEILPEENILTKNITHWAIYAETRDKIETLRKFLIAADPEKALIFTSRADQVENIFSKLSFKKIQCAALHAKTDKQLRKAALDRFRSGKNKILITSDLSARGLDIPGITHIIQMDLPSDNDFFVHRAGRTARAGKKGINVVIGDEWEMRHYAELEKKLGIIVYPKEVRAGKVIEPFIK